MAQFRSGATSKLQTMPQSNAMRCLAIEPTMATKEWEQILAQLLDNEWFDPQSCAADKPEVAVIKRVSGFRGFGGNMVSPPTVGLHEGGVVVRDEASVWRLYADCYGWHLHRLGDVNEIDVAVRSRSEKAAAVRIDDAGRVQWGKTRVEFKHLAGVSSQAFDGKTLAVTVPTSYHVFLIADKASSKGRS
jgi:hypothetical protein